MAEAAPAVAADPFADDLALITEAARQGAQIALEHFKRDPEVWYKDGNSPVSEADFAVDRHLRRVLLDARPDYGWLSEEMAPAERAAAGEPERFFVVDPIDGTRSFLRGEGTWCVAVSVVERGANVAAVLDVPVMGEIFTATRDGAALLNGAPIAASRPAQDARLRLGVPDPLVRAMAPEARGAFDLAPNVPSLAYRLALVASGRVDGTLIRPRANDWDIAAGDLILERAGGLLQDVAGERRVYRIAGKSHGVLVAGGTSILRRLSALAEEAGRGAGAKR